jgi:peptidoglycan/LPS O-acetylase OafA/YrhL
MDLASTPATLGTVDEGKPAPARRGFYRPELDGLRFFAFFAVFWSHVAPREPAQWSRVGGARLGPWLALTVRSGSWGLDLFFVLSSYLITELLLREIETRGTLDVRSFWIRRALRIWPLYFATLLGAVLVAPRLLPQDLDAAHALAYATFTANWATVAWGPGITVMGPLWSISIEEQFYFVWPLITRWLSFRRLFALTASLLVVSFVARVALIPRAGDAFALSIWCNTLTRLDPIAGGALLAMALRRRRLALGSGAAAALLAGSALTIVLTMRFEPAVAHDPWLGSLVYLIDAAACVGMLLGAVAAPPERPRLLTRPALVYLGRISYGLYVYHGVAILLVEAAWRRYAPPGPLLAHVGVLAAAFLLTVAFSVASYRWLEEPFLRLKERFSVIRSAPLAPPTPS